MVVALSWSRISDYRQCPHKYGLKYVEKAPNFKEDESTKSPHLIRGSNVHKALENYVIKRKAGEQGIPASSLPEVESTKPFIDGLFNSYQLHPEMQIAVDDKFKQVDWFSRDASFRVIFDLIGFGHNLLIGDYKTGKLSDYSGTMAQPGQLHMSTLIAMALWPQFEEADNRYIYVDHRRTIKLVLNRTNHFEPLKEKLIEEHAAINADIVFTPKKNQYCCYCAATPAQCQNSKKQTLPGQTFGAQGTVPQPQ